MIVLLDYFAVWLNNAVHEQEYRQELTKHVNQADADVNAIASDRIKQLVYELVRQHIKSMPACTYLLESASVN